MKSLPVIILGAGGHARVLLDALQLLEVPVIGITDPDSAKWGTKLLGVTVIGNDQQLDAYDPQEVMLVNGLGAVGIGSHRDGLYAQYRERGYDFLSVVHPRANIAPDVRLDAGVQVMAGAIIQTGSVIGSNTIINTGTNIDHECEIGANVHIAPGCTLSGMVRVGTGTFIGAGSTIVQEVSIGAGCVIGAGSVVLKDIPSGSKSWGVPAKSDKLTREKTR